MKQLFPLIMAMVMAMTFTACGKDERGGGDTAGPDQRDVQAPEPTLVTIGTGGITGIYYPTGGAIAHMVNNKRDTYHIHCVVEATGGSVFNVNAVMAGDLQFGVVRSDRQYQALKGTAEWAQKGPQKKLRAVFSIYPESVTLVAAVDAGIKNIQDLKGKRVYLGGAGTGAFKNATTALETAGIDYEVDLKPETATPAEVPELLQQGRIDAFFYTVGHPDAAIGDAVAGARKVRFVPIAGIDGLLARSPFYARSTIPVKAYPGVQNSTDVVTFGVKATLVASADTPDQVVYAITREVFENLDAFRKRHPAFSDLTEKGMLEGLSAPIHPGARKYYMEAGLM